MSMRDVVNIACKLLSIYTVVNGLTGGLAGLASISISISLANNRSGIGPSPASVAIMSFGPYLVFILVGVGLWLLSDKISDHVWNENHSGQIKASTKKPVEEIQTIAFTVLGLFFIGSALPKAVSPIISLLTLNSSSQLVTNSQIQTNYIGKLLEAVVQLAFGIWLLLGTHGLVNTLKRLRRAGVQRDLDSESHPDSV